MNKIDYYRHFYVGSFDYLISTKQCTYISKEIPLAWVESDILILRVIQSLVLK